MVGGGRRALRRCGCGVRVSGWLGGRLCECVGVAEWLSGSSTGWPECVAVWLCG